MSAPARSSPGANRRTGSTESRYRTQRLSASDLEAIKAAHPLHEMAERYGLHLATSGARFVALCPFHAEQHPSFTIFPNSQRWWCFGCQRGGDVIDLVRLLEGVNFREAVEALGGGTGSALGLAEHRPSHRAARAPANLRARWLAARASSDGQRALDVAVACYARELEEDVLVQRYLARRSISGAVARACSLGSCSGTQLRCALRDAGVPLQVAWDTGLLVGRDGTERFAGRVVIPEVRAGHACWLTGRLLDDRADEPRYMSLPGARPLLGADRIAGQVVVVGTEGAFDFLTLTSWGMPAFAALGGSLSPVALAELHTARVIYLAFDRDTPGQQAARSLAQRLEGRARIVVLPEGVKDVNELGQLPAGRLVFQAYVVEAAHASAVRTGRDRGDVAAATASHTPAAPSDEGPAEAAAVAVTVEAHEEREEAA